MHLGAKATELPFLSSHSSGIQPFVEIVDSAQTTRHVEGFSKDHNTREIETVAFTVEISQGNLHRHRRLAPTRKQYGLGGSHSQKEFYRRLRMGGINSSSSPHMQDEQDNEFSPHGFDIDRLHW
jgi:hypothetical protein